MNILEPGHSYALYKNAYGPSWVGRLSYFSKGKEFIPLVVGNERLILEMVIPEHIMDSSKDPKYYLVDDGKYFLMRKNYREINLYKLTDNNYMGMVRGDESLFPSSELGPLFITTIRKALSYYVSLNPETTQFIFEAEGEYGRFMSSALINRADDGEDRILINTIPDLIPPYYGFELNIVSLKNCYDPEDL